MEYSHKIYDGNWVWIAMNEIIIFLLKRWHFSNATDIEHRFFSLYVLLGLSNCLKVWVLIRQHCEHKVRYSFFLKLNQQKLSQICVLGENWAPIGKFQHLNWFSFSKKSPVLKSLSYCKIVDIWRTFFIMYSKSVLFSFVYFIKITS